jgi:4-hydroxy-3-methylbut-2-enyl diphosphate reductase
VKRAAGQGRDVIIVGDRGHAEVVGLLGFSRGRGHVVESVQDVDALPALGEVAVVAQTTQSEELYGQVEERVRQRFPGAEVYSTICGSTADRQRETAELGSEVDVMVVVGGRQSANTMRLVQIARETGKPTLHVESAEELRDRDLEPYSVAGVTAGASTPNWVIEEVVTRIEGIHRERVHPWIGPLLRGVDFSVRAGLLVALGAGGLAFVSATLLDRPFRFLHFAIPVTYVFSMLNWNTYAELQRGEMVDRARAVVFRRHGQLLTLLAVVLAAASLLLAACVGIVALLVLSLSAVLGLLYAIPIFPEDMRFRYRRLKDLPGSRNIFFAAAVAVITVVIPLLDPAGPDLPYPLAGVAVPLLLTGVLAFARSVVLDVKDLQSDLFAGRDTIPVVLGKKGAKVLLGWMLGTTTVVLVVAPPLGWVGYGAWFQVLTMFLTVGTIFLYHLRSMGYGILFHSALDTTFLLAALVALAGSFAL